MTSFEAGLLIIFFSTVLLSCAAILERRKARDASRAAYEAVVALSDVAEYAHELAEMDMRTAVSMEDSFYGVQNFTRERNPTAQRAKMRGYEVYRNERLAPIQKKLDAAYKRYESATRRLIAIYELSPLAHAVNDLLTWWTDRREKQRAERRRKNTADHPYYAPIFRPEGTGTGRFTSDPPNLQSPPTIERRSNEGRGLPSGEEKETP